MKFRSCVGERVDDGTADTFLLSAPEGTFAWGLQDQSDGSVVRTCRIVIPYVSRYGGSSLHIIRVHKENESKPATEPSWLWDGNEDKPTLTPSIACGPKDDLDWHGHMTAGILVAHE